jgi:hypothetical protein
MDNDARLTLLPFLDLLFAAIGIFLILIFQALTSGAEPRATAADLVLICDAAPQVGWLEPGGEVLALDRGWMG